MSPILFGIADHARYGERETFAKRELQWGSRQLAPIVAKLSNPSLGPTFAPMTSTQAELARRMSRALSAAFGQAGADADPLLRAAQTLDDPA